MFERNLFLLLTLLPSRILWLGFILYLLGILVLYLLHRTSGAALLPPLWAILLIGGTITVGAPALVLWQLRQSRIVEKRVKAGETESDSSPAA